MLSSQLYSAVILTSIKDLRGGAFSGFASACGSAALPI